MKGNGSVLSTARTELITRGPVLEQIQVSQLSGVAWTFQLGDTTEERYFSSNSDKVEKLVTLTSHQLNRKFLI